MKTLCVIGLGKLGSPMLAVFAEAGFTAIGVDTNPAYVDAINAARAPVEETGLQDLLTRWTARYSATADTASAVTDADADGGFTLEYVTPVCHEIGAALRDKVGYTLVIMTSTTMPGQMREICDTLEQVSGKREGVDFGLCYSPEFIALGSVIHDFQNPDYAMVGAENAQAGDMLEQIYHQVHKNGAPIVRLSWVNGEIAKIAQNSFITMKITYANQLGNLCGAIPGADVDEVTRALGHDRRVGKHYLKAGTAFGGPCFPRDNRALVQAGKQHLADFGLLAETVDQLNEYTQDDIVDRVYALTPDGDPTVGILGLAYKPGTSVIEESASIVAAQALAVDYTVIVYDPLAMDEARAVLGESVQYAESAQACIEVADAVILMHPDGDAPRRFYFRDKVIIDPWRSMQPELYEFECKQHIPLGIGPAEKEGDS
ncbi:MAG: nucleotide sugar dehydrogenase [Planctomycetota bacterium]|jgi:UDPglucose 6-dehydrogenase